MSSTACRPVDSAATGQDNRRDKTRVSTLNAHRKLFTRPMLSSPMNKVRSFSENFRLSGFEMQSLRWRLPSASGADSSAPTSSGTAAMSTGTHSLSMATPPVSDRPPCRRS
ncbi:hypothetical protein D3C72_1757060 [compost metagenome]